MKRWWQATEGIRFLFIALAVALGGVAVMMELAR